MLKLINAYFEALANQPANADARIQWLICTIMAWVILSKKQERILKGLEGVTGNLEGGESVIFLAIWLFPPILFSVAFFKGTEKYQLYALAAELIILLYAVTGRYIFDWLLAVKTGQGKVEQIVDPEVKTVTTTTTEVK